MSLDYNLTTTSLPRDDNDRILWTQATEAIIFFTMTVGIGDLTEKNAPEFFARVNLYQAVTDYRPEHRITQADIAQHIGLKTNVGPMESRTHWLKRVIGYRMEQNSRTFADMVEETTTKPVLERSQTAAEESEASL